MFIFPITYSKQQTSTSTIPNMYSYVPTACQHLSYLVELSQGK